MLLNKLKFRLAVMSIGAFVLAGCLSDGTPVVPPAGPDELVTYTETREPCDERSASRNAYFGDLHIQGKEGIAFYTQQRMTLSRWFEPAKVDAQDPVWRPGKS